MNEGAGDGERQGEPDGRIEAICEAFGLKDERRTGWQLRDVRDPESVAAHSWGVAFLCLLYGEEADVDVDRTLALATLHDLAEARTGDVATRADPADETVDPEEKRRREERAIAALGAALGDDVEAYWTEYEARETPESRFVKDMDLIDMCVQALVYEREGRYPKGEHPNFDAHDDLDEFFATAEPRLSTDVGRRLFDEICSRYERVRDDGDRLDTST